MKTPALLSTFNPRKIFAKQEKMGPLESGILGLLIVAFSFMLHGTLPLQKDPLVTTVLKAKYFPNTSFWLAKNTTTKSIFWASILQVKEILNHHCTVQFHKGNSSIWSTP
jgi:hypothetical protein